MVNKNNYDKSFGEFTCVCGRTFRRKTSYYRHVDVIHKPLVGNQKSGDCDKTFYNANALNMHAKKRSDALNTKDCVKQDTDDKQTNKREDNKGVEHSEGYIQTENLGMDAHNDKNVAGMETEKDEDEELQTIVNETNGANYVPLSGRGGDFGDVINKCIRQVKSPPTANHTPNNIVISPIVTCVNSLPTAASNHTKPPPNPVTTLSKSETTLSITTDVHNKSEFKSNTSLIGRTSNNNTLNVVQNIDNISGQLKLVKTIDNQQSMGKVTVNATGVDRLDNNSHATSTAGEIDTEVTQTCVNSSLANETPIKPCRTHVKKQPEISPCYNDVTDTCAFNVKKSDMRIPCMSLVSESDNQVNLENTSTQRPLISEAPTDDVKCKPLLTKTRLTDDNLTHVTPCTTVTRPACSTGTNVTSIEENIDLITMYKTNPSTCGSLPMGIINKRNVITNNINIPVVKAEYGGMDIIQQSQYNPVPTTSSCMPQQTYFNMDDHVGQSLHEVLPGDHELNDIADMFPSKYTTREDESECNFPCYVCGKRFLTEKYLSMHISLHGPTNKNEASIIAANNTSAKSLQETLVGVTQMCIPIKYNQICPSPSMGLVPVPTCITKTLTKTITVRKKQPDNGWTCKLCSKSFAHNSGFKNHMRTHSNERPYICQLCDIGFKEKYHLKKHNLFIHSTELPEKCKFCGKRFKDSTAVRAHERIHSDARPFGCRRCGKSFKTSECLWHHEHRSKSCGQLGVIITSGSDSLFVQQKRPKREIPSVENKAYNKENMETKITTSITPVQTGNLDAIDVRPPDVRHLAGQYIQQQTKHTSLYRLPQPSILTNQMKILQPDNIAAVPAAVANMFPEPTAHITLPTTICPSTKRSNESMDMLIMSSKKIKREPEPMSPDTEDDIDEPFYVQEEFLYSSTDDGEDYQKEYLDTQVSPPYLRFI